MRLSWNAEHVSDRHEHVTCWSCRCTASCLTPYALSQQYNQRWVIKIIMTTTFQQVVAICTAVLAICTAVQTYSRGRVTCDTGAPDTAYTI